jgi:glucose/arabinose dehydrogenase
VVLVGLISSCALALFSSFNAGAASALLETVSPTINLAAAAELPVLAISNPIFGLSQPVSITHAGDGSGRIFVVEQGGRIRIIRNGAVLSTPFLDISGRISTGGERGLLGLAFAPGYASNGRFYVNYTNTAGDTVIARYARSTTNPDLANASSEQIVITIGQPFANHNGRPTRLRQARRISLHRYGRRWFRW